MLLFLAFISGAGYVLWALLMKNNPVSRIAVFGLLIPVVTVLLSALLNGETLADWRYLAALALVCAGIWLVNLRPAPHKGGLTMTDIFDTHAHYCSRQFEPDRDELMQALPAAGVTGVLECATPFRRRAPRAGAGAQVPVCPRGRWASIPKAWARKTPPP